MTYTIARAADVIDDPNVTPAVLDELREDLREEMVDLSLRADREGRDFTPSERRQFDDGEKFRRLARRNRPEVETRDAARGERRRDAIAAVRRTVNGDGSAPERRGPWPFVARTGAEPAPYRRGGETSFIRDMVTARSRGDRDAFDRLDRNERMVAAAEQRAGSSASTAAHAGGDFTPPYWVWSEYAPLARAGRPFADACTPMTLPPGADTINIPQITTGTATGVQSADNIGVTSQDWVTATVSSPVVSVAGQFDFAQQLLDQSPTHIDELVFADLIADLALRIDLQALLGTGASGQALGALNVASIGQVTFTSASPTVALLYSKIALAIQTVISNRKLPPTAIFMTALRWAWFLAATDSTGRPLVSPNANGPNNALGLLERVAEQSVVGNLQGLPVLVDQSLPTNLGAGTNQDVIVVARMPDLLLFEGQPVMRLLDQILSGTLALRAQVYQYLALAAGRYPSAVCRIDGTGLVQPTL